MHFVWFGLYIYGSVTVLVNIKVQQRMQKATFFGDTFYTPLSFHNYSAFSALCPGSSISNNLADINALFTNQCFALEIEHA